MIDEELVVVKITTNLHGALLGPKIRAYMARPEGQIFSPGKDFVCRLWSFNLYRCVSGEHNRRDGKISHCRHGKKQIRYEIVAYLHKGILLKE